MLMLPIKAILRTYKLNIFKGKKTQNLSSWETKAGGIQIEGQPGLHTRKD